MKPSACGTTTCMHGVESCHLVLSSTSHSSLMLILDVNFVGLVHAWEGETWGRLVQERKQGRDDGPYVGAEDAGSRFGLVLAGQLGCVKRKPGIGPVLMWADSLLL